MVIRGDNAMLGVWGCREMSLLSRLVAPGLEQRTLMSSNFVPPPAVGVIDDFVGVHRAMANMTVLACVRLLADTIASLPWKAYRRDSNGVPKELNPQPAIINSPFPGFDLFEWKWMTVASMALRGNAYNYVTGRDKNGYPSAILPLHPDIVFLERRPDILMWFDPIYRIMGEAVPRQDMIHMRRFTMPGEPWGLSPIRQAAVAIGLGLSAEEYGYRFYKESATPSGTLTTDQDVDEKTLQFLQKNWIQSHGGRRLPAVLSRGFEFKPISIRPDEAQFLECCAPGTFFTMADGSRRLVEELQVGESVMAWDGAKLVSSRVKAIGTPPVKEVVKVTTARGRELVCTADHPVLGLKRMRTPGGRPLHSYDGEWMAAGDLEPGQYVRIALGHLNEGQGLSEDIGYFLGAMVGDGYIRSGSCSWSSGTDRVTDRMSDAVESLGGALRHRANYDFTVLTGGSGRGGSVIRGILNETGLVGSHSHDKFVPEMITVGGQRGWRAFLSAYFDADGSIRDEAGTQKPAAYWSSTSVELLQGCQHLLALLGINSAIYPMGKGGRKVIRGIESAARPNWGLYVMGMQELAKLSHTLDLSHPEKRRRLRQYAQQTKSVRQLGAENFEYDSVKTVECLGPGQTIGVEIEDVHTHVTSGIITHNTRQFQRSEICLLFGVPPILIGDTKETTAWGTGVQQITLGAVTYTFRPWTSCIESVMSACLPRGQFVRFDYNALLRGDMTTRYAAGREAVQGTMITPNEWRASEEMDPVPGGDKLLAPPGVVSLDVSEQAALAASARVASTPPSTSPSKPAAKPAAKPAVPAKTPGSGTLPMPPVGGGESNRADDALFAKDDLIATLAKEMRSAYHSDGKPNAMLNGGGLIHD